MMNRSRALFSSVSTLSLVLSCLAISPSLHAQQLAAPPVPPPESPSEHTPNTSYWIPAVEIVGQQLIANIGGRLLIGGEDFNATPRTAWDNITGSWVRDSDALLINQIGHPYQGAFYFNAARSSGLGFWTSSLYTTLGSLAWEYLWETVPPSINDQFTTTLSGILLGEVMHRVSYNLTEGESTWSPKWILGSLVNPMGSFNRDVLDLEVDMEKPSATLTKFNVGYGYFTKRDFKRNGELTQGFDQVQLSAYTTHGLAADRLYEPDEPLDHFVAELDLLLSPEDVLGSITSRAMVVGTSSEWDTARTIQGLYIGQKFLNLGNLRYGSFSVGAGIDGVIQVGDQGFVGGSVIIGGIPVGAAGRQEDDSISNYNFGFGASEVAEFRFGMAGTYIVQLQTQNLQLFKYTDLNVRDVTTANSIGAHLNLGTHHALGVEVDGFLGDRVRTDAKQDRRDFSAQGLLVYTWQSRGDFGTMLGN